MAGTLQSASSDFLVLCLMLLLTIYSCNGFPTSLEPPKGNSLKLKSRTQRGNYVYKCSNKTWVPVFAFATLVNLTDSTNAIGNYSVSYAHTDHRFVGMWTLKNDDADSVESGSPTSIVAGIQIASMSSLHSSSIPQVLAEASFHKNEGIAYQISYIQRINTKGGILPKKLCSENSTIAVPFEAEFWFYTQDVIPPSVPAAIMVPSGRMVEGFFCTGPIIYSFDGSQWQRRSLNGKLYNVPGGDEFGSFYMKDKADNHGGQFLLQTENPNGWQLIGKISGRPTTISNDSLPWTLFTVTSSSGNVELLGPFSYFQMVATRGGIPPMPSKATKKGELWTGRFSAQLWIYT
ncbi:hypothetical protein SUGI_1165130 [Cryptomeria japonica]|uniref:uncharacterized protein LOC131041435 n=1 Tax=Cryptomeria japonica TaxID=3369 RepID=UPI002414921E|nr:uncharacterized protein LOC131041435 [Cryptomeria japonica]GLJ54305.1 hypothetical protein SUGI_1165130 [Cryptomeria japonica]